MDASAVEAWGLGTKGALTSELTYLRGLISEAGLEEIMTPRLVLSCFLPSGQNLIWIHLALGVIPSEPSVSSAIKAATLAQGPLFTTFLTVSSCLI